MYHMMLSARGSYGVKCYGLTKNPKGIGYMLILEYMENGDLNSLLRKEDAPDWKEIYLLLYQIFSDLGKIHSHNMVHKDIHPGNILFNGQRWSIGDFGLCGPADKD